MWSEWWPMRRPDYECLEGEVTLRRRSYNPRMDAPQGDVTHILHAVQSGDADAREQLFELVYDELRRIARRARYVGQYGDTLQPTVLANEAYIELARRMSVAASSELGTRVEFFMTAALAMRTILRDHWRSQNAAKRGGGQVIQALGDHEPADLTGGEVIDFLALDAAMQRLEAYNPRWYRVVMYRHFAGRSIEETSELLSVALSTVKSDWQLARAWLRREIEGSPE